MRHAPDAGLDIQQRPTLTGMDAMTELWKQPSVVTSTEDLGRMSLRELGELHRLMKDALAEIEDALAPKIVAGSARGMTYTELAVAAGYGSPTTITKIMRDAGASPGRGSNQPMQRRRRVA